MRKTLFALVFLALSGLAHAQSSPAKKELVQKFLTLQQPGIEGMARSLVERPVAQMAQEVRGALQQLPAEKRETAAKSIDADIKKYIDAGNDGVRAVLFRLATKDRRGSKSGLPCAACAPSVPVAL